MNMRFYCYFYEPTLPCWPKAGWKGAFKGFPRSSLPIVSAVEYLPTKVEDPSLSCYLRRYRTSELTSHSTPEFSDLLKAEVVKEKV